MEENKRILTKDSLQRLQDELDNLVVVKRKEIAAKIKEAREQGDLSENAEYDAAKDEQRDIEARIEELEDIIKNSEILDESAINLNKVHIGCTVTVKDRTSKKKRTFQIVVPTEVDSRAGRISNNSPLGKALLDREVGEVVEVAAPAGIMHYQIMDIETYKK